MFSKTIHVTWLGPRPSWLNYAGATAALHGAGVVEAPGYLVLRSTPTRRDAVTSVLHVTAAELRALRTWREKARADVLALDLTDRDAPLGRSDARRALAADLVLIGSLTALRETRRRYPTLAPRTALLRTPLDIDRYTSGPEGGSARDELTAQSCVLFAGPLVPTGGLDLLLEALATLRGRGREVALVALQFGAREAEYAAWCCARAAAAGVLLSIRDGDAASPEIWSAADIVCTPYRDTLSGDAARHAAAAGVPIIASEIDPFLELVDDGRTGALVAVDDVPALTATLAELTSSREICSAFGRESRLRARQELCPRHAARRLVDLWVDVAARRAPVPVQLA